MAATVGSSLPLLLPGRDSIAASYAQHEWTPTQYLNGPQPPPTDDLRQQELEMAAARQMADGKVVKKTRPRRTVDYTSDLGRWTNVCAQETHFINGIIDASACSCVNFAPTLHMYHICGQLHLS